MRWLATLACLIFSGCGWQAAGSPVPTVVLPAVPLSIRVGQTTIVALPAAPAGETRTASTSASSVATAYVDAQGNLDIAGIAPGTASVSESDIRGTAIVTARTYAISVTP